MTERNGTPTPNPWDQRPGESSAAYRRFLIYRDLGPGRSLRAADRAARRGREPYTKRHGNTRCSGQWSDDCRHFDWVARAHAWDVHQLAAHGQAAVVAFVHALEAATAKLLQGIDRLKGPANWKEVTASLLVLSSVIPAETIEALAAQRERAGAGAGPSQAEAGGFPRRPGFPDH